MRTVLILITAVLALLIGKALSQRSDLSQSLLQSQGRGSCTELPQFGVSTHRGRNPDSENIKLASEIHAPFVRLDIPWSDTERNGQYYFAAYDNLIEQLLQSGHSIILVLAYGHPDHSDGRAANGLSFPPGNPDQRAAFSHYVQAVAKRYHGPNIVYEIWNEPNIDLFWPPKVDVNAYGQLLASAARAIRDVDPTATIIAAGLANENDPPRYLESLADQKALDEVNGITLHPYRQGAPELSLHDIDQFKSAISKQPRPVWITEWGYSEAWLEKLDSDTRRLQATMVARLMLTAAFAKVKALVVYDLIDDGDNPQDQESSFGLAAFDFKLKPAGIAFKNLAEIMTQCQTYDLAVDSTRKIIIARFLSSGRSNIVLWTYDPADEPEYCFDISSFRQVQLSDLLGEVTPTSRCQKASEMKIKLSYQQGPVILQAQ